MEESFKFWTRRILAFIVCVPTIGVLAYLSLAGVESAMPALVAMASMVVGFYFGTRANQ